MGENERWTNLGAFSLVLLFAAASDGLMEMLGPGGFLVAGAVVLAVVPVVSYSARTDTISRASPAVAVASLFNLKYSVNCAGALLLISAPLKSDIAFACASL